MAPTLLLLLHTFFAAAALTSLTLASVISVTSASPSRPRRPDLTLGSNSSSSSSSAEKSAHLNDEVTQPVAGCPSGQYFSDVELACHPCSSCPVNQIIRRPCSARADTWCGPFLEFDKFHQTPVEKTGRVAVGLQQHGHGEKQRVGGGGGGGRGKHHPGHSHHGGHHHDKSDEAATEPDLTSSVTLDRARTQWRTLSFALIVVLCVVCGLVVFVGLYVFTVCRRSRAEKQYFREPELLTPYRPDFDPEPRYVETYVTSRDRLRTSRHLPVYQQIYTGSDASEFPPLASSSSCRLTTKERSTAGAEGEEDQYVYFNCPAVNANEP